MKILALEFSSRQRSVALLEAREPGRPNETGFRAMPAAEIIEAGVSADALSMVDQALREAGWKRNEIDRVAVGIGPGSYNGIRSSIALVQGWELATGVQLVAVRTPECLAAQAQEQRIYGRVCIVIDAEREEFYLTEYRLDPPHYSVLRDLRLASLAEIREIEKSGAVLAGPGVTPWFASGCDMFPRASTIARLASAHGCLTEGSQIEPIYFRPTEFVKAPPARFVI